LGKWAARKSSNRSATIKEKLYFFEKNLAIASKDLTYDQIDKPLIQIRDEAHRFANAYRKKQMIFKW
jgi:excinuclease UvrABC nuclease subunit